MTTASAFSIRPARPDDAKAFRMLLPDTSNALDFRLVAKPEAQLALLRPPV